MSTSLNLYLAGTYLGRIDRSHGSISMTYDTSYLALRHPTPLSLTMPPRPNPYPARVAEPWLANLLSDHPTVRRRLAHKFGATRTDIWSLLEVLGADMPGAIQVLGTGQTPGTTGQIIPWDEARIAEEIRRLHTDEAWVDPDPARGHWSLAGAQGKLALARTADGWEEPAGAEPSTHILKVGIHQLDHSDIAEFVTMRAAAAVGINVAPCELELFEDQPAVIITRYDRVLDKGRITRLHQEDLCQALSMAPERKYQSDGGPSWRQCLSVMHEHLPGHRRATALRQLLRWQVFNLLTASTDGHAKNLSILLAGTDRVLAPAYDLISVALLSDPQHLEHAGKLACHSASPTTCAAGTPSDLIGLRKSPDLTMRPSPAKSLDSLICSMLP